MKKYIIVAVLFSVLGLVGTSLTNNQVQASSTNSNKIIRIDPYMCGMDPCDAYRCVGNVALTQGISVSPACYNAEQLSPRDCRNGTYIHVDVLANKCTQEEYYMVWTR